MYTFDSTYWALIIGGSSGFGLATARKLAEHGMNICIVHRDRRSTMRRVEPAFDELKQTGVKVLTFNVDAIASQGRDKVLSEFSEETEGKGRIRVVLHSLAFGNLKLLAPSPRADMRERAIKKLAERLEIPSDRIGYVIEQLFQEGTEPFYPLAEPPNYLNDVLLDGEDFSRTIHAMGYNIVEWINALYHRDLLAESSRVVSLTSEGNSIAWRGYAAVSAAKAVLESVSKSMAVEFAPYGVRSNVIQAGVTDTPALRAIPGNEHIRANARLRNPCGRLTVPEDVANAIYLLCMDEASWINGSLICVDGGERIG